MKSPSISIPARGLTLSVSEGFSIIEIIVVIAIIGFLATFGVIAGLDTFARYNFHSERDSAIALLQKARSEAINNIGEAAHGVYFGSDQPDLILFSGASYTGAYELKIEKSKAVSYSNTCAGDQVVFTQLSGGTTACEVKINGVPVTINNEGGIDY